ncbi:LpqB family beta-propeller domain-containing protein [Nocardioides ferulae]|uniref:LpqB family beta-propeller domain-containing protein n=1 Tax=Nocardioides ferulae TaxID=2340821 RepID=UPI0013DE3317|nr:LpqB family beta-propeller domain-containing protein [Nocardioides ferulae]
MTATPIQANVARQYLAADAQASWDPELGTITYDDASPPRGSRTVSVRLTGGNALDAVGAWEGPLSRPGSVLRFPMTVEKGEWRITRAPDALIVPEGWFEQRYRQVSLYYFDPSARVLVPEPVFVPRGDQLATALIRGLLRGPSRALSRVVTTFIPPGLESGLSVTVDAGVAEIALAGNPGQLSVETNELILAQLAWTLRQEPGITALRVTVNGEPLRMPGGASEYDVTAPAAYDPTGFQVSTLLYGLQEGLLVSGTPETLAPVDGPFGRQEYGVVDIGVNLDASRVAAVSADGSALLEGPVTGDEPVATLVSGGTDLARPAWDFAGRMWLLDRRVGGAAFSYIRDGRQRELTVPGISGQRVTSFLVSRDGSRLAAVVRRSRQDVVLISRLRYDGRGRVLGATPAERASWSGSGLLRARSLTWLSPTTLAVLHRLVRNQLQVRTISVDGAPVSQEGVAQSLLTGVRALVGSPKTANSLYALTGDSLLDLSTANGVELGLEPPVDVLHYAG